MLVSGCSIKIPEQYKDHSCVNFCYITESDGIDSTFISLYNQEKELLNQIEKPVCRNYRELQGGEKAAELLCMKTEPDKGIIMPIMPMSPPCEGCDTFCDCQMKNGKYVSDLYSEIFGTDKQVEPLNFEIINIEWSEKVSDLKGFRWFNIFLECNGSSQGVYVKANGLRISNQWPYDLTSTYSICEKDESILRMFVESDRKDYDIEVCLSKTDQCVKSKLLSFNGNDIGEPCGQVEARLVGLPDFPRGNISSCYADLECSSSSNTCDPIN